MTTKTSIRLTDYDKNHINELKKYLSYHWEVPEETITTTDIISWSIGVSCMVKRNYEYNTKHNDR